MPTYQYRCTECGRDLEIVQKFSDASLTECPTCSGALRKVFNAVGVVFKGSGFYRNDSRAGNGDSVNGSNGSEKQASEKATSGDGKSGDSKPSEAKPSTAPESKPSSTKSEVAAGSGSSSSSTGTKAAGN